MSLNKTTYNSELLKGTGLIQETLLLLDIYRPGISKTDLINKAIESNVMVKDHNSRIKDIVNHVFNKRYLKEGEETVLSLQLLKDKHIGLESLSQVFFVYTCRANRILFDFVSLVYQRLSSERVSKLPGIAAKEFISEAIKDGRIEKPWAESTKQKVSEHIHACLIDFKLIDRQKNILPFYLQEFVANYFFHELHFKGYSDLAIIEAEEWSLFGYTNFDVIRLLERISFQGHYIFQNAGDLIKITWNYNNMYEFINGTQQ